MGLMECVRALVKERGAEVGAKDKEGNDVAAIATSGGNLEVLSFPVQERGGGREGGWVDVEGTNHNKAGARLLYIAARYGHEALVKWLVKEGKADIRARSTESGVMAHHAAAAYGHLSVLQYLLKEGGGGEGVEFEGGEGGWVDGVAYCGGGGAFGGGEVVGGGGGGGRVCEGRI